MSETATPVSWPVSQTHRPLPAGHLQAGAAVLQFRLAHHDHTRYAEASALSHLHPTGTLISDTVHVKKCGFL